MFCWQRRQATRQDGRVRQRVAGGRGDGQRPLGRRQQRVLAWLAAGWHLVAVVGLLGAEPCHAPENVASLTFRYTAASGIGQQSGVCRRDPSDVIRVGGTWYVYYTKVVRDELSSARRTLYPSGYTGTIWYATSRDAGRTWEEQGEALGLGEAGDFDAFGVFTPNILYFDDVYWLYYTGVRPTGGTNGRFENNSVSDTTAIGLASASSPAGPFQRVSSGPMLRVAEARDRFDSYRVDDACLLPRNGQVWLYYKGRSVVDGSAGPGQTRMGVAVANSPRGPYLKQNHGRAVQDSGHEVQVFGCQTGVYSLVSPTGPQGRTLQHATDGIHFRVVLTSLADLPKAPGLFRPELTEAVAEPRLPEWGIAMGDYAGDPYLVRFECLWTLGRDAEHRRTRAAE